MISSLMILTNFMTWRTNLINDPEYDGIEQELRAKLETLKAQYKYNPDRDWWLRTQIPKKSTSNNSGH